MHASVLLHAQSADFDSLMVKGKAEFGKAYKNQDFAKAIQYLEKAVRLKPGNPEAHYFLGYAYSRFNAKDGRSMIETNKQLTLKSSRQFEKVIELSPKYKGEMVLLDPYSKTGAEWSSLAMKYWYEGKKDSAGWAFSEGKARGGFGDFLLAYHKKVLKTCSKNAILISSGDNHTFPLWYLQMKNQYRKDVSVIDISLLNTNWYPHYLSKRGIVKFDIPEHQLDSIQYCKWSDTTYSSGNFKWEIHPAIQDNYLGRNHRILLSILRKNEFRKDVYFTKGFGKSNQVGLHDHLLDLIIAEKVDTGNKESLNNEDFIKKLNNILPAYEHVDTNSTDQLRFSRSMRIEIMSKTAACIRKSNMKHARKMFAFIEQYFPESKCPYNNKKAKNYIDELRSILY